MYAQSLDLAVLLLWGSPLPFGFVGFWIFWWNSKAFGSGSHIISMIRRNLKKKTCKCQKVVKNFIPAFKKWQTKLGNRTRTGDRSSLSQVILVHCAEKQIGIESFFFQLTPHILEQLIFLGQYYSWDKEEETGHSIFFTISVISLSTKKKNVLFQLWISASEKILFLKTLLYLCSCTFLGKFKFSWTSFLVAKVMQILMIYPSKNLLFSVVGRIVSPPSQKEKKSYVQVCNLWYLWMWAYFEIVFADKIS